MKIHEVGFIWYFARDFWYIVKYYTVQCWYVASSLPNELTLDKDRDCEGEERNKVLYPICRTVQRTAYRELVYREKKGRKEKECTTCLVLVKAHA